MVTYMKEDFYALPKRGVQTKKMKVNSEFIKKFFSDVNKNKALLLLAAPVVIWVAMFCYAPMFGIILAFKDLDYAKGIFGSSWCGFENFQFLFHTKDAWVITRNTIGYNLVWIPLGIMVAVFLAILFDVLGRRRVNMFTKINQTMSIMPHFLSWVVISYFVDTLLNMDKGFINNIMSLFGKDTVNWYSVSKYWPYILTVANLWKSIGYSSIVYYATIKGFNSDYYEAAWIDGASWWQQTRFITLPQLLPIIMILGIMSIGGILNSDFGLFYIIPKNSGILYSVTSTLDTYIYNAMTTGSDLGATSAVSFYKSVVGFVLILGANKLVKKLDGEFALF